MTIFRFGLKCVLGMAFMGLLGCGVKGPPVPYVTSDEPVAVEKKTTNAEMKPALDKTTVSGSDSGSVKSK